MPRFIKPMIICVFICIVSMPVSAELYQYRDKNGIMRLTDDIYSVPVEYRSQLKEYSEIESISDEMEIQPLKNKPVAENVKQPPPPAATEKPIAPEIDQGRTADVKTNLTPPSTPEKTITPKTEKTLSAGIEKKIVAPDVQPEISAQPSFKTPMAKAEPEPASKPFESAASMTAKKHVPEQHAPAAEAIRHISNRILIERKPSPAEKIISAVTESKPKQPMTPEPEALSVSPHASDKPMKQPPPSSITIASKSSKINTPRKAITDAPKPVPAETVADEGKKPALDRKTTSPKDGMPRAQDDLKTEKKQVGASKTAEEDSPKPIDQENIIQQLSPQEPTKKEAPQKNVASDTKPQQTETPSQPIKAESKKDQIPPEAAETPIETKQPEPIAPPRAEPSAKRTPPSAEMALRSPTETSPTKRTQDTVSDLSGIKEIKTASVPTTAERAPAVKELPEKETTAEMAEFQKTGDENTSKSDTDIDLKTSPTEETDAMTTPADTSPEHPDTDLTTEAPDRTSFSTEPKLMADADTDTGNDEPHAQTAIIDITADQFAEKDERQQLAYLQTTRKSLAEKKQALNKKYMELMKEKETLENSVNEDDAASVLEYNKNVKKLNIKIKLYKKEKKRLQAEIEKYNRLVRQVTAN